MNATVIPFLLGALMSVEDVKEWNFGPEYIFELTRSLRVYMGNGFFIGGKVTAMVKCRLNVSSESVQNVMFCRATDITVLNITHRNYESWKKIIDDKNSNTFPKNSSKIPDQLFKIEFSRQGVQNYKLKAMKKEQLYNDIITDIIDQFNIGIDLSAARDSMKNYEKTRRPYQIFSFSRYMENMIKAKCKTSGSITYKSSDNSKDRKFPVEKNETNLDFRLKQLLISYTHPDASGTFLIERSRKACIHQSQYFTILNAIWMIHSMKQYSGKIKIENSKFSNYAHLEGDAYFPMSQNTYSFWQNVYLQLFRIRPAREELNTAEYE